MPKPVAGLGEGHEDASGNGVYCFIRDLIVEGRDARFVDKKGRYVINWSRALKCYHDYKSKRNPQYKSKNINRRKASNGLRAALLNFYKKEGAKEYKDCKKVNDKDEVVERQFQMPPRVFESLFGSDAQLSDDSSEHETSSITSEADEKPLAAPNSSDTGFDEAMDISDDLFNANEEPSNHCALGSLPVGDPLCSNVKTEEDQVDPSDITPPCQMFDISGEELDLVIGEICSNSDTNDMDLLGVVRDICPSSGSVKGGIQFYISLTEELSEDDKSGIAHFDGIGDVCLEKLNAYTLAGTIPASQQPGTVPVTVSTQDGRLLGMTCYMYVDEIQEVLKQVVKDPALQSLYLTMWSQEYGLFGNDGNLDAFTLQGAGTSIQGTHAQALKGLQLLVYTAAQTNAQQFIQMIFSTSAGRLIFNAYKDRPQLPEDVARANGHDDLAQYLQDVNTRLSKENSNDAQPSSIDWLELIEAVNKIQKQSSVDEDETDQGIGQSKDDDNESDYFADAETSSCGSFELEIGWSDSEGPSSKDEQPKKEPDERLTPFMEGTSSEERTVSGTSLDSEVDHKAGGKSDRKLGATEVGKSSLISQLSRKVAEKCQSGREEEASTVPSQEKPTKPKRTRKWLKGDDVTTSSRQGACVYETQEVLSFREQRYQGVTRGGTQDRENISDRKEDSTTGPSQAKRHKQSTQWRPSRRALLTITVITVLCLTAGIKLREGQLIHWEGTEGQFLRCPGCAGLLYKTPLPLAAKNGHKDLTELLVKLSNVYSKNYQQHHLAVWSGCQEIANALIRHGSDVNARDDSQQTPLHLVAWSRSQEIANALIRHGGDVNVRDDSQRALLQLAVWSGWQEIANALIRHGSDVNARDDSQRTPLHLAAWSGCQEIANALIRHGSDVTPRDDPQQTPLHLTAWSGCQDIANALIQHGSDVNARDDSMQTPLHLVAWSGCQEITNALIRHGSGVNARDDSRQTPLHLAALKRHRKVIRVLIQSGSDVNAKEGIFGWTPLHLAASAGHKESEESLVQHESVAAMNGLLQMVTILKRGSDVNSRFCLCDQEITEILTQQGSDLGVVVFHCTDEKPRARSCTDENARDGFQPTPIHFAAGNGHENISEALKVSTLLTRYGNDYFNNKLGDSPLHLDAWSGHQERTEFLISHGNERKATDDFQPNADVNVTHNRGQSPLHLAAENGYKHICDVLRHENCHALNNHKTNFPQTSCEILRIHWGTRSCLGPVNLFIGLGDKPSVTQCLSISLGGGGRINHHINRIKCFNSIENSAYQGLRWRYTSLIDRPFCILCSTKLATNGRPKDKDGNEAKISHSLGFVDKCIKNGTNKVLIRSELPVAYEGNHLVNATVLLLLLMTLVSLCAVLRIRQYYLEFPKIFMEGAHNGCRAPSNSSCVTFKQGRPGDSDLDVLAGKIAVNWQKLGLHLGISLADLDRIDEIEANESRKAYRMLLHWRNTTTSTALYRDLYFALCHHGVALVNLAKQFCGKETTLLANCKNLAVSGRLQRQQLFNGIRRN